MVYFRVKHVIHIWKAYASAGQFRISGNIFTASYEALEFCWQIAPCSPQSDTLSSCKDALFPPKFIRGSLAPGCGNCLNGAKCPFHS